MSYWTLCKLGLRDQVEKSVEQLWPILFGALGKDRRKGTAKTQETLSQQFIETIKRRLGVHLTPHQLRHLAAIWYLEENPEDFETPRSFLGHAWTKTTRVYSGSSTRRASKAYSRFVIEKRDALKLKRKPQLKRKAKSSS